MGKLHIISHDHMIFTNRQQAADCLADLLLAYRGGDTIVVGISRGGVILADHIAEKLGADMDVAVCQKIHLKGYQGPVVGAVAEDADMVLNPETLSRFQPSRTELEQQMFLASVYMRIQRDRYRDIRPPAPLQGRTVILVDDGMTTGITMTAALRYIQARQPTRVVVAVPLGPEDRVGRLSEFCDELLCYSVPVAFSDIADYYRQFPVVNDARVLAALKRHFDCDLLEGTSVREDDGDTAPWVNRM
ncbi:MAG: phosphoribosyl transferase [Phycisphaeraceae bacterium]|nr:phosphoribosyl transferase [Phycisphaeraceae bacterium]